MLVKAQMEILTIDELIICKYYCATFICFAEKIWDFQNLENFFQILLAALFILVAYEWTIFAEDHTLEFYVFLL